MKRKVMMTLAAAMLLLIGAGINQAHAQIVEEQVIAIGDALADEGFDITHDLDFAYLNNGESETYELFLDEGVEYFIYAVCDGDCSDLDLCLYDENGNKVECDEHDDDIPYVTGTPAQSETFYLEVSMFDCDIEPCKFGIVVFGR